MRLVDVHCHLEAEEFAGNLDQVLADARAAGIVKLITASITPEQWDVSESLAARYPEVAFALGIHPWYIKPGDEERVAGLRDARARGAVAIGEIGLDSKIPSPSMEEQVLLFEAQLVVACELDLPVVIHCRGALGELARAIKAVGMPKAGGIVHAFSGSCEVAEELIGYGLSFALGGSLTYRNSKKRDLVLRRIYPEHLLLETDSPDIPPVQIRGTGQSNVPAFIRYNLSAAAETLGETEERVAAATTANARRIFRLEE